MSRYPHRALAERNKRVQMQNCIEDKFLKQKLDSISREKLYIARELRRISLAKESLMESLDRYTAPQRFAGKRLPLKVALELLHDRVLGSLRRRLLMTSTQEPNTMAPQSALYLLEKMESKINRSNILCGTKTSEFCLRIISCSSLEPELSFDSKNCETNFDRAGSTIVKSLH